MAKIIVPAGAATIAAITERQQQLQELARRLLAAEDVLRGAVYLKCDFTGDGKTADTGWRPVIDGLAPWGSRGDLREPKGKDPALLDNTMIVAVPAADFPARLPHGVVRLSESLGVLDDASFLDKLRAARTEHERQQILCERGLDFGWLDQLRTPYAELASGRFSLAHTTQYGSTDTFTYSQDPLSGHANWSALDDDCVQANGSAAVRNKVGAADHGLYQSDDIGEMPTADYSVDAVLYNDYHATNSAQPGLVLRCADATHFYMIRILSSGGNSLLQIFKNNAGYTQLGSSYTIGAGDQTGTARIEAVGSAIKGYWDGTERISATDSALSAAEYAGLRIYLANNTTQSSSVDDFKAWIEIAAPTNVSATDGAFPDKVRVTWTKSVGATGYEIYRAEADVFPGGAPLDTVGDVATYDDETAVAETLYYYWVVATSASGDSDESDSDSGYAGETPCPTQWASIDQTLALNAASNSKRVAVTTVSPGADPSLDPLQAGKVVLRREVTAACTISAITAHYSETITAGTVTLTAWLLTRTAQDDDTAPALAAGDVVLVAADLSSDLAPENGQLEAIVETAPVA